MLASGKARLSLYGLIRIIFRWYKTGLFVFFSCLICGIYISYKIPLKYETQIVIEKKYPEFSPKTEDRQFDMTRLTSDIQRMITLLKSRFIMEQWMDSLAIKANNGVEKERQLKILMNSLSVRPVNFTDLFIVKVKAESPEKAVKRIKALIKVYTKWDLEQSRKRAQELIVLLDKRMKSVNSELNTLRDDFKQHKKDEVINFSGSVVLEELQTNIRSKEKLYDNIMYEIEVAQRQLQGDRQRQIQIIAQPTISEKPLHSRMQFIACAVALSIIIMIAVIMFFELQISAVYRAGEIHNIAPLDPVITIPKLKKLDLLGNKYNRLFDPILNTINENIKTKGSVIIQVISSREGNGKTTITSYMAQAANNGGIESCIFNIVNDNSNTEPSKSSENFEKNISKLKEAYKAIFVDIDTQPSNLVWNNIVNTADITCIIVESGRTSKPLLELIKQRFSNLSSQKLFFVLNFYKDPIPGWLQGDY